MVSQHCNQQNCLHGRQGKGWPQKRLMEHSLKATGVRSHLNKWALKQTQPVIFLKDTKDQLITITSH